MESILKYKNKKALSEIVAYVLLIVMSLALASGVYVWLKKNVPADKEVCSDEIALSIKNYTCATNGDQKITLVIENKGFFSANGFFIRGSNQTDNLPVVLLLQEDPATKPGRYDFKNMNNELTPLIPGDYEITTFLYNNTAPIKKIQIQPFVLGEKTNALLLCPQSIINQEISGCGDATPTSLTSCINQTCDNNPPSDGFLDADKTCSGTFTTWYQKNSYKGLKDQPYSNNFTYLDGEWITNTSARTETAWYWFQANCTLGTYDRYISINSTSGLAYGLQFPCSQKGINYC